MIFMEQTPSLDRPLAYYTQCDYSTPYAGRQTHMCAWNEHDRTVTLI